MRNYLYYSSIFALFTEELFFTAGVDIKLFYFILAFNFVLMGVNNSVRFNSRLLAFYFFLLVNGFLTIYLGDNEFRMFVPQFLGIAFASLYYFNFFVLFEEDLEQIFKSYTYVSLFVAVVGIVMVLVNLFRGEFVPLESIMLEPAHYVTVIIPAYFYSLKNKQFPRYVFIVLLISILLSGSSLGLLALCLSFLLISDKVRVFRILAGVLTGAVFIIAAYTYYDPLRLRVDDTVKTLVTEDLTNANVSSFALVSNLYIAQKSLEQHPVIGSGLGSHELTHKKYIYDIQGIEQFRSLINLNAKDAGSLLFRVMSDLGIVGLLLVGYFVFANYGGVEGHPFALYMSRAILLYFFCKLLREGHYFSPEMYFFVFGYAFVRRMERAKNMETLQNVA